MAIRSSPAVWRTHVVNGAIYALQYDLLTITGAQ
jgi:hypothetical protein